MRVLRSTLSVALLAGIFGAFAPLQAQTGSVTGTVRDASTGQPLVGAQMVVVGTNTGALTNAQGRFLITGVAVGEREIRAVIIGYSQQSQTVNVTPGAPIVIDFDMATSAVGIDGIMVNAITGQRSRGRELGTANSQISLDDINPANVNSVADILSGRTSGLVLQDVNGTTGTSQRIRIRGSNSISLSNEPLILVDGVEFSTSMGGLGVGGQEPSRLNDINPADIANIEVIKGPAASALYGTAAGNGVILITTKRGRAGQTNWEFWVEAGELEDRTDYPSNFASFQIDDPSQPVFLANGNFNSDAVTLCSNIAAAGNDCTQDQTISFNTMKDSRTALFSEGDRQRYGMSVRGGGESVRYFISGQYEKETGIVFFNSQERVNLRTNMDAALSQDIDVALSVGYTDNALKSNSNDNSIFSPILNGITGFPNFRSNADGSVSNSNFGFGFGLDRLKEFVVNQEVDRFTTSAQVNARPRTWLTLNVTTGLDFTARHDFSTIQPGVLPIGGTFTLGRRQSDRSNTYIYNLRPTVTASFNLTDEITSTTSSGVSYEQTTFQRSECFGASLIQGTSSCGTTSTNFAIDEDFSEVRTIGFFFSQELGWRDKVFVTGTVRADDDSTFGGNSSFIYFPSVSGSWVISEESFFPQTSLVTGSRLRVAYGESGVRPNFRQALTLFNATTVAGPGGDASGVVLGTTGNANLKAERAKEFEFGFETGLLNERISIDFTYFDKESEDALIAVPLPPSGGLSGSVLRNLGAIENKGTELTVNVDVYQSDLFGVNVGMTNSTLDSEILDIGGVGDIIFNRGLQRHSEGFSAGGFFQQKVSFNDADGNGLLEISEVSVAAEDSFLGPSQPEHNRTVFADVRVFDWITISTLFEGRGGHLTASDSEAFRCGFNSTRGCRAVADPTASLEDQAAFIADRFLGSAEGFVEDGNFWRWREFSAAFDMPSLITNSLPQLDGLRLTLSGRNLKTFTDFSGIDPETVEAGGSANFSQSEFNTQPPVRQFLIRLDYRF